MRVAQSGYATYLASPGVTASTPLAAISTTG